MEVRCVESQTLQWCSVLATATNCETFPVSALSSPVSSAIKDPRLVRDLSADKLPSYICKRRAGLEITVRSNGVSMIYWNVMQEFVDKVKEVCGSLVQAFDTTYQQSLRLQISALGLNHQANHHKFQEKWKGEVKNVLEHMLWNKWALRKAYSNHQGRRRIMLETVESNLMKEVPRLRNGDCWLRGILLSSDVFPLPRRGAEKVLLKLVLKLRSDLQFETVDNLVDGRVILALPIPMSASVIATEIKFLRQRNAIVVNHRAVRIIDVLRIAYAEQGDECVRFAKRIFENINDVISVVNIMSINSVRAFIRDIGLSVLASVQLTITHQDFEYASASNSPATCLRLEIIDTLTYNSYRFSRALAEALSDDIVFYEDVMMLPLTLAEQSRQPGAQYDLTKSFQFVVCLNSSAVHALGTCFFDYNDANKQAGLHVVMHSPASYSLSSVLVNGTMIDNSVRPCVITVFEHEIADQSLLCIARAKLRAYVEDVIVEHQLRLQIHLAWGAISTSKTSLDAPIWAYISILNNSAPADFPTENSIDISAVFKSIATCNDLLLALVQAVDLKFPNRWILLDADSYDWSRELSTFQKLQRSSVKHLVIMSQASFFDVALTSNPGLFVFEATYSKISESEDFKSSIVELHELILMSVVTNVKQNLNRGHLVV